MPRPQRGIALKPRQHLYAYCHIRTNQVLYSLTQNLHGRHALKQLPDAGANNNPPTLRKDLWKPLWILSLPDTPTGHAQCLHAYKKLREWRILHETSWTPPTFLSRKYTPEEIEKLEKKLQDRGGSKKETVYDVIKHENRKLRARMVMDQKANSIADLAAVLQEQAELGARSARERQQTQDLVPKEMLKLTKEAQNGRITEMEEELEEMRKTRRRIRAGENVVDTSRRQLERDYEAADRRYRRMLFACAAVAKVSPKDRVLLRRALDQDPTKNKLINKRTELQQSTEEIKGKFRSQQTTAFKKQVLVQNSSDIPVRGVDKSDDLFDILALTREVDSKTTTAEAERLPARPQTESPEQSDSKPQEEFGAEAQAHSEGQYPKFAEGLPPFPSELSLETLPKSGLSQATIDKRAAKKERRRNHPIFTDQNVSVRWQNILDAEYAAIWPARVKHRRMGVSRHKAPSPDAPAPSGLPDLREILRRKQAKQREITVANEAKRAREIAREEQAERWSLPRRGDLASEMLEALATSPSKTPSRLRDALTRLRNETQNEKLRRNATVRKPSLHDEPRRSQREKPQQPLLPQAMSNDIKPVEART